MISSIATIKDLNNISLEAMNLMYLNFKNILIHPYIMNLQFKLVLHYYIDYNQLIYWVKIFHWYLLLKKHKLKIVILFGAPIIYLQKMFNYLL